MRSVLSRLRLRSQAAMVPRSLAFSGSTLLTMNASSRRPASASATTVSASPFAYISAVSISVSPRSRPARSAATSFLRAVAVSADGTEALSGSFDTSAIRWSLTRNAAEQVLSAHDDAVNAVAFLRDGRGVTAGADGRIAIWSVGKQQPDTVLEGHTAPI